MIETQRDVIDLAVSYADELNALEKGDGSGRTRTVQILEEKLRDIGQRLIDAGYYAPPLRRPDPHAAAEEPGFHDEEMPWIG